jgi:hypothetical protein
MKTLALIALLPAFALAQPRPGRGPGPGPHGPPSPEERARIEKKMRVLRVVELAEQLDLDEKAALRMSEQMDKFVDQRRAIHDEQQKNRETIEKAAQGDAQAQKSLDAAVRGFIDNRRKMNQIDLDEWLALGQGLKPQQQARLALFLAEFPKHMHKMAREAHKREMREHRKMMRGGDDD